ncbi:hypothetical protein ACTFIZ_007556 [Dictyostelium cf. discoideum]
MRTGLGLAQAGEFGFVLLNQISGQNLVDPVLMQAILAAMLFGQNLAGLLEQENISYIALDLDPDRVREATTAGQIVVYGDATIREALSAGIHRAAALVITYANTASALKVFHHVHELERSLAVVVRTVDDADIEKLQKTGAAEVVPEIIEGSLMLASHALVLMGVPMRRVVRRVQQARDARYSLLRGYLGKMIK